MRGLRVAPEGMPAAHPAFDVTPARYVTAIVTEAGVHRPPYEESCASPRRPSEHWRDRVDRTGGGDRRHRRQRVYDFPDLEGRREVELETPFGAPSDAIVTGRLEGRAVAFLPATGGGTALPQGVPYRANIFALKRLGVRWIIAVSACGSMRGGSPP